MYTKEKQCKNEFIILLLMGYIICCHWSKFTDVFSFLFISKELIGYKIKGIFIREIMIIMVIKIES